jgi:hypothetical protein
MSTFTLSERCGRVAGADAEAGAEIDAAGGVGAGCAAAARGTGAESKRDDATSAGTGVPPREDW